ncbi:MAG: cobalamin B12-binding domain-containing protein [Deltaproteobacteria bacterium]|nr:cobalamin B12-binding domain-containing protein [Deltaproteobacteria bacterium]
MNITFAYLAAESMAIEILSAVLKGAGHNVKLAFDPGLFDDKQYLDIPLLKKAFSKNANVIEEIKKSAPDLVCFSVGTDNYQWACEMARNIKKKVNVPIIFGGIHVTAVPERVIKNDFVDMVCVGEGEEAIIELTDCMQRGITNHNIRNIWFKVDGNIVRNEVRPLISDLDVLPYPDKGLFERHIPIRNGKYMMMTSRGCPYQCSYCYNNVLRRSVYGKEKKYVRQRSVESVINELKIMKEKFEFTNIAFMDDCFVTNRRWFRDFTKRYKEEIGLPYSCMAYTGQIDEEMGALLKDSGCNRMMFGIQTMDKKTREEVLKRSFETDDKIKKALAICDSLDIPYSLDHIFGTPFADPKEHEKTAEFYSTTKAIRVCCYALFYYPKTEITEDGKKAGILSDEAVDNIEEGKARLYVYGSSLRDDEMKVFRALRNFYALLPIAPSWLLLFLIKTKLYKLLRFMPRAFALACEAFVSIKTGHERGVDYIRYYLQHLKKIFTRKQLDTTGALE